MSKPWFKIHTDKWLDGSTRRELNDEERARWVDILALCARYEGKHANTSGVINMTVSDLAWFWREDESQTRPLLVTLEIKGKIKVFDKHIEVCNWQKYNPHHEELKRESVRSCAELCEDMRTLPENQMEMENQMENQKQTKKRKFGEFTNVLLTEEEYEKLVEKFGETGTKNWIETLSTGLKLKGYKYKSHYLAILKWSNSGNDSKPVKNQEVDPKEYIKRFGHLTKKGDQ